MRFQIIFFILLSYTSFSQNLAVQDPNEYVSLAVQAVSFNFPDRAHHIEGFFRQCYTNNKQVIYHSEAAIEVQDGSYFEDTSSLKIKINSFRIVKDSRDIDSVYIKQLIYGIPKHILKNRVNDFYNKYLCNYVRLIYNPFTVFSNGSNFIWGKQFRLEDLIIDESDTICKFEYSGEPLVDSSYLMINTNNLAIQEFTRNQYIQGNILNKVHVKFKKASDEKFYPIYIKVTESTFINRDSNFSQFVITEFFFKRPSFDFKMIRGKDVLNPKQTNFSEYNKTPEYWDYYFKSNPEYQYEQL